MTECAQCKSTFYLIFRWRYPCTLCQNIFCDSCSHNFPVISPTDIIFSNVSLQNDINFDSSSRVCDKCYISMQKKRNRRFQSEYILGKKLGDGATAVVQSATRTASFNSSSLKPLANTSFSGKEGSSSKSNKDTKTEKFAIKIVQRKSLKTKEEEASIFDEVRILSALQPYNNIVQLYDFFTDSKCYYTVLEEISGGELFDRIVKKSSYTEKEARDLVKILLEAIKHCHDRGVVHR
jgi:serine/threonine protein kinase